MKNHDPATPNDRANRRKALMTLVCAIGLFGHAQAQTVNLYSFSSGTGASLDPMSGASQLLGANQDDAASAVTNIGFSFNYESANYTQFSINSQGSMQLGGTLYPYSPYAMNYNLPTRPTVLLPYAGDGTTADGSVTTTLIGSSPNQIRIVQWNVAMDYNPSTANILYQVWLYEGTNVIEFRYGAGAPTGGNSGGIQIAITGANPANYLNVLSGLTASSSSTALYTNSNAWPGNGTILTFSPPAPCTSPTPGNTVASVTSGCPGVTTALSLQTNTSGSGVSYQWQSSPDGSSWSDIDGATNNTYATGALNATIWYQCLVTCATGPSTVASTPVQITVSEPAMSYYTYAGSLVTESFATWANRCSSTGDVPNGATGGYWRNYPAYGPGTWRASNTTVLNSGWSDVGGPGGTTGATTGAPTPPSYVAVSQTAARFHARQGGSVVGTLDFYVDMSAANGTEKLRFEYTASSTQGSLAVYISQNGGSSFSLLGTPTMGPDFAAWYTQEFTIGSTSPITVIRLQGTAGVNPGSGNDIGVDNFRIIPAATCAAPTAPSATATGPGTASASWTCSGCTGDFYVEYGPSNFTLGNGTVAGPFTSSPAIINGLANGSYKAYVRQDCGGGNGISENAGPVTFNIMAGDFCGNAIDLATVTHNDWSAIANSTGAGNDYSTSACSANQPGPDLVFFHDVEAGATLSLGLWSSGNRLSVAYGGSCPGTTSLACANSGGYFALGGGVQLVNDYETLIWTNNGCGTERIYVLADGISTGGPIYIINYAYTPPGGPVCAAATGLAVSTVNTGTGANVSWSATCSGNASVEYGPAGFTPGTGTAVAVSGTSTALSGLALDTPYDVYVRQDCGGGLYSAYGSPATFTLHNGDDCSRVIALSGASGSIVLNTTGTNNDISACVGGNTGGDLILSYDVAPGYGIYFTSAPVSPYVGHVAITTGPACPGNTYQYCNTGAADFFYVNEGMATATVYFVQDGTNNGSTTVEWLYFAECELYDSDEDGVNDCTDTCPDFPGQQGDPCDDGFANTVNDVITGACQCAGTPCTTDLTLEFRSDVPSQTTWELRDAGTNNLVQSGGPLNGSPETNFTCLPDGCFVLRVLDSGGDGMVGGGYVLRTTGDNQRIIDNSGNFSSGSVSAIAGNQTFCLPMGTDKLIFSSCDKLDWVDYKFIVVAENPAVSAQYGVSNANSGYEFWFYEPNGGYSFRRFRSHSTSDGYGTGALRANHFKINGWVNSGATPHIPANTLLNVRVRGRVAGSNLEFGPACLFKMDTGLAACPRVKLQDDPANAADYSCGVTRSFGGGSTPANRITANPPQPVPTVSSANVRYQFRFRIAGEGICIVRPAQTSARLVLNWAASTGAQLQPSKTYDVDVRVSLDAGATWCFGPATAGQAAACADSEAWGKVCKVTIDGAQAQGGSSSMVVDANSTLTMYPNPNRGDQLFVNLSSVEAGVSTVSVDIFDLTGKKVTARTIAVQDGFVKTNLDLNGDLANGMYIVSVTAGSKAYTERLVIQK
ncbi:MAG: T9SS type A sorting domain-containing protein [Flavobacteriales bacterium]|nr:T9SS type A sorting domain-containing protein [Flavobacteriales bacterium]